MEWIIDDVVIIEYLLLVFVLSLRYDSLVVCISLGKI